MEYTLQMIIPYRHIIVRALSYCEAELSVSNARPDLTLGGAFTREKHRKDSIVPIVAISAKTK